MFYHFENAKAEILLFEVVSNLTYQNGVWLNELFSAIGKWVKLQYE